MKRAAYVLAMIAVMSPTVALACHCDDPSELTEAQIRYSMRELSLVARGRVVRVEYPTVCSVAPLRWIVAPFEYRAPVTYRVKIDKTYWGKAVAEVDVVQRQLVEAKGCRPLGGPACEPKLPSGDALWVLKPAQNGKQRYAGRCGLILVQHVLGLTA